MNKRRKFATLRQLTRDTFRQACASGINWMMLAVTALCALLCLSVNVSGDVALYGGDEPALFLPAPTPAAMAPSVVLPLGSSGPLDALTRLAVSGKQWFALETNPSLAQREGIDTIKGRVTLAFGAVSYQVARERGDEVHFLEMLLAGGIAGTFGLLLALVWTAGFVPSFLEPSAASVLLAKPAARWRLLLGKYFGVVTFVGFQVTLFVILTWLALGIRTQVWDVTYLCCIPLLLLQFAVFYSFSVLLGVRTRSTVACVFGCVLFWLLGWGINYGKVMAGSLAESQSIPSFTRGLANGAYWLSPKPIDAGLILFNAMDSRHHFDKPETFRLLEKQAFSPHWSILSCLLITSVLLALSVHEFNAVDY
jgi:ABC-type transport system involved in multi-copper enzyme maturation permease subunit